MRQLRINNWLPWLLLMPLALGLSGWPPPPDLDFGPTQSPAAAGLPIYPGGHGFMAMQATDSQGRKSIHYLYHVHGPPPKQVMDFYAERLARQGWLRIGLWRGRQPDRANPRMFADRWESQYRRRVGRHPAYLVIHAFRYRGDTAVQVNPTDHLPAPVRRWRPQSQAPADRNVRDRRSRPHHRGERSRLEG